MKKVILRTILGTALVFSLHAGAQAQLSLSINIGRQPAWGPTGYNHVDYYYLPDIESYYDVSTGQYIYQDGGRWIFANSLPPRYRGYDLYSGYKVVVNRPKPYLNFSRDRVTYGRYKNWSGPHQAMLREHRDNGNHFGNGRNRPGNGNMNRPGYNGNVNHGGGMNRPYNMNHQGGQPNQMGHGQFDGGHQQSNDQHGGGGHEDHGHH
ncbi:hypothetical protein [Mucilaginibacter arboris]|uniref:Uncharacterized protein n=1 Tax=Mucilaginibacter arboris TaxID=2682090 RepID=A0A7K1SXB7_9SPHI|nr:hypothetical protein [Mucilaginibacter arboris]MVN21964.1 hypothetical protein [Mucilaginibacter arboris]